LLLPPEALVEALVAVPREAQGRPRHAPRHQGERQR